ncbi:ABC transporter permease [Pseudoroseomonas cervicalis]|uniref:ABC transporter permease n=1 Tax=Teichococcus cervicalis TaxID=204525 RepID=UPI002781BA28|nr:ABC transporter permease [Pseudoroseomonas cervicalis]MDQ1078130.1 peptide/nickel transport system permease protein [Pseudoroseomonas cervicalis]
MSGERFRRGLYRFRRSWVSVLGLVIVLALLAVAILGPAIVPHPDHVAGLVQTGARFQPPSAEWWFGTNEVGQDVFSLTLAGTRISLLAGMAVVLVGAGVGVLAGAVAGFFGGWVDEVLMRLSDLMLTVPSLILAMAVAAALGPGTGNMIFAIALSWWPGYARLVRGEVMAKKEEQFVTAARAMGAGPARLLRRHILPNIISPVIVKMSLDMGFAILTVASLGFVGIGVKPPTPEWGSLLSVARANMPDYWWTAIFPGLAIFLAVFGFNLLGDGLRDLLDPKARR